MNQVDNDGVTTEKKDKALHRTASECVAWFCVHLSSEKREADYLCVHAFRSQLSETKCIHLQTQNDLGTLPELPRTLHQKADACGVTHRN